MKHEPVRPQVRVVIHITFFKPREARPSALVTDEVLNLHRLGGKLRAVHNDRNRHLPARASHWHGPGKIPHIPPTLESRGCSLLELRCWSLTMTGLRLSLRGWCMSAARGP